MKPLITCVVAGIQYLLHPQKLGTIQETINPDALIPVTLLTTSEIFGDLDGILQLFDSYDDVFVPDFGGVLIEKPGGNGSDTSALGVNGSTPDVYRMVVETATAADGFADLPSGPYFLYGPNLYQAWRLYEDYYGAFTFGVIPDDVNKPDGFQVLTSLSSDGLHKAIPVPSRLYHPPPSARQPLSGLRTSIDDAMTLNGTYSSLSSQAWWLVHSLPADSSAAYARQLLDMGAVIIGKTKTAPLEVGAEWVDEQAPWSPRGDGYQVLSGSSVGAEAGIMGYGWLHQAVGVDANGGFSGQQGLYSISPSRGKISLDGVVANTKSVAQNSSSLARINFQYSYSNVRFLSQSLSDLSRITFKSIDLEASVTNVTTRIIQLDDLHSAISKEQRNLTDEFIIALEKSLEVKAQKLRLEGIWAKKPPVEAKGQTMQTYMEYAPFQSFCYEYYHAFDSFRAEYRQEFAHEPFVEATPRLLWNTGANITRDQNDENLARIKIYRDWFEENVLTANSTPNAETILVLPCDSSGTRARDQPTSPPTTVKGVTPDFLAAMLRAPQLAVPFAQLPYKSRISGRTEYKPFCVSVIGTRGSDAALIRLVKQALELAHRRTQVETGRFTFPRRDDTLLRLQNLSEEL
ncbi:hypothetical protein G7046_g4681 [Stylonectria norvegica]|nr:hypothetical protein G7046_g4681 [Stylonectria norvegica]